MSLAKHSAFPAEWGWVAKMVQPVHHAALPPVEQAIARIRKIYRDWTRDTSIAQMRNDWDAAFATPIAAGERVIIGEVSAEWTIPQTIRHHATLLYFHGGGFRMGSVASHRGLSSRIADASGCRVLAIDYRLSPEHCFPAPVEDAVAAYRWLSDQGTPANEIVMVGDSAGGNLVLAAMLWLRNQRVALPKAAVLMSPWTDLAATGDSFVSRAMADPIHQRAMVLALAAAYLGGHDPRDPLASPLYADLTGLSPMLVQVGDRETVRDDAVMLAEKAKAAGVQVDLEIWDGMIHVFQMFNAELAEADQAIASIARFIDAQFKMTAAGRPT